MNEWKKYFVTPEEFHNNIIKLANMIPKNKYENVYAIPRGGLIIGVYLSHYLDIPLKLIYHSFYDLKLQSNLIVDDIADTGRTLLEFKDFDIATVYYKPRSIVKPTYYAEECSNDRWIVFPFEKAEEEPNREV